MARGDVAVTFLHLKHNPLNEFTFSVSQVSAGMHNTKTFCMGNIFKFISYHIPPGSPRLVLFLFKRHTRSRSVVTYLNCGSWLCVSGASNWNSHQPNPTPLNEFRGISVFILACWACGARRPSEFRPRSAAGEGISLPHTATLRGSWPRAVPRSSSDYLP